MDIDVIDHDGAERPARPAATLVLARDRDDGLEVLLIHRGATTAFGGMWAFPGGVVEEGDVPAGSAPDPLPAARRAAVRESLEEVGLVIDEESLVLWSHWLPPMAAPRRFSTWFFLGPAEAIHDDVGIDGTEVRDHRWMRPADVIAAQLRGEIELAPPTFVTLDQLLPHHDVAAALAAAEPFYFATQLGVESDGVRVCLFDGDVAFNGAEAVDTAGARHRVRMDSATGWRYTRT
jgi:8-oxo-dGTP pyrophosphatase MutT (NUDIX family)